MNTQIIAEYLRKIADLLVEDKPKQYKLPFDEMKNLKAAYKPDTLPEPFTKPRDYGFNIAKSGIYVTPTTKRALGYKPRSFSFTTSAHTAVYFSGDDTLAYKINPSGRLAKLSEMEFYNDTEFKRGDFVHLQQTANTNIFKIK